MDARALTLPIILSCGVAAAAVPIQCPSEFGAALPVSSQPVENRLHFIRSGLELGRSDARLWANTWGSTWLALTAAQTLLVATDSPRERRRDIIFTLATPLGLIPTWIFPPEILTDEAPNLFAKPDLACADLRHAELLLQAYAEDDRRSASWLAHISDVLLNVAIAFVAESGFHHWRSSAGRNLVLGVALGEAQIFTRPQAAFDLRQRYVNGDLAGSSNYAASLARPHWALVPIEGGALLNASFVWR